MSLKILAPMVVVGIAIVIGAVIFLGLSRRARIDSENQIRQRLAEDFPEILLREGIITADRRTAFFQCGDGRVAMAQALGSKFVTRLIDASSIRMFRPGENTNARLELDDFTFPVLRLGFDNTEDVKRLSEWLEVKDRA